MQKEWHTATKPLNVLGPHPQPLQLLVVINEYYNTQIHHFRVGLCYISKSLHLNVHPPRNLKPRPYGFKNLFPSKKIATVTRQLRKSKRFSPKLCLWLPSQDCDSTADQICSFSPKSCLWLPPQDCDSTADKKYRFSPKSCPWLPPQVREHQQKEAEEEADRIYRFSPKIISVTPTSGAGTPAEGGWGGGEAAGTAGGGQEEKWTRLVVQNIRHDSSFPVKCSVGDPWHFGPDPRTVPLTYESGSDPTPDPTPFFR
jgi:hypothetical protein